MAIQRLLLSIGIIDGSGRTASMPLHMKFEDTVVTLADILASNAIIVDYVDAIIDGKVTDMSFTIQQTLPETLKTDPLAPSNVQETGLFTFAVADSPYSFGIDLPTIAEAVQSQGVIPDTGDVATFTGRVTNAVAAIQFCEPVSRLNLASLSKARVSFRKRR